MHSLLIGSTAGPWANAVNPMGDHPKPITTSIVCPVLHTFMTWRSPIAWWHCPAVILMSIQCFRRNTSFCVPNMPICINCKYLVKGIRFWEFHMTWKYVFLYWNDNKPDPNKIDLPRLNLDESYVITKTEQDRSGGFLSFIRHWVWNIAESKLMTTDTPTSKCVIANDFGSRLAFNFGIIMTIGQ